MTERWLEALGDAADGALVIDEEQRIIFSNRAAIEIIGQNGDEISGSFCYVLLGGRSSGGLPICRENCRCTAEAARGRPVKSFDMSIETKSAGVRWLNGEMTSGPMSAGWARIASRCRAPMSNRPQITPPPSSLRRAFCRSTRMAR